MKLHSYFEVVHFVIHKGCTGVLYSLFVSAVCCVSVCMFQLEAYLSIITLDAVHVQRMMHW
jgi:hypothetical protein